MFSQAFSCYLVSMLCFYWNNAQFYKLNPERAIRFFIKYYETMMYIKKGNTAFEDFLSDKMIILCEIDKTYRKRERASQYGGRVQWIDNFTNEKSVREIEVFISYYCGWDNNRFTYYIYRNNEDFWERYPYLEKLRKIPAISDKV